MAAKDDVITTRRTPASTRRTQNPQCAFARRHDQVVLVFGHGRRQGRCHVQHIFATRHGLRPARVAAKISGDEGQAITRRGAAFLQQRAQVALALQAAHGGAHLMARGQQLQDAMAADEARPAGDQDCADRRLPLRFQTAIVVSYRGLVPVSSAPLTSALRNWLNRDQSHDPVLSLSKHGMELIRPSTRSGLSGLFPAGGF